MRSIRWHFDSGPIAADGSTLRLPTSANRMERYRVMPVHYATPFRSSFTISM